MVELFQKKIFENKAVGHWAMSAKAKINEVNIGERPTLDDCSIIGNKIISENPIISFSQRFKCGYIKPKFHDRDS